MLFDIEHGSFVDGPGIRTAVFFKGCNLRCTWCHNPESQLLQTQLMVYRDKCIGCGACACQKPTCDLCGACVEACPAGARRLVGEQWTPEAVLEEILEDVPFYGSEGGVTFTGGECMLQPEFLQQLLGLCREAGIHTAVDTAGCVPWTQFEAILPLTDLFLYDVKTRDAALHKTHTGQDNRLILENLGKLLSAGARVWVRWPVIPGVNDDPAQLLELRAFYGRYGWPERTQLLPFHAMGENKYPALGRTYEPFAVPDAKALKELEELLLKA